MIRVHQEPICQIVAVFEDTLGVSCLFCGLVVLQVHTTFGNQSRLSRISGLENPRIMRITTL